MSQPLVSIITPAYNLADYLPETIESVLSQDYPNIEYIVLDDGSSDHTRDVLSRYDGRLHWETHDNMGESRTVNKGLAMSQGKYVVVVNADDPLRPGMVTTLVAYMQAHPDVLAVYPDWLEIDQHSETIEKVEARDYDYADMVSRAACVPGPGAMIRRTGLEKVTGRQENYRYVSDMDFWFRLGLHGPLARYPEPLATHRTHRGSSGVARRAIVGEEIIKYIEGFFQRADLPAEVQQLRQAALSSAWYEAGIRQETYAERRDYFLRSFRLNPKGWLDFERYPLWTWRAMLLPEPIHKLLWVISHPGEYLALRRSRSDLRA